MTQNSPNSEEKLSLTSVGFGPELSILCKRYLGFSGYVKLSFTAVLASHPGFQFHPSFLKNLLKVCFLQEYLERLVIPSIALYSCDGCSSSLPLECLLWDEKLSLPFHSVAV